MASSSAPLLLLTPGEPAGIGPDLAITIAREKWPARLAVVADPDLLKARAKALGVTLDVREAGAGESIARHQPGQLIVLPVPLAIAARPGELDTRNASYVLETLRLATETVLRHRNAALVTGPVQKSVINDAGIVFSGHTEFLAELLTKLGGTAAPITPVMMLVAGRLRVALATTHLALQAVPAAITQQSLTTILRVLDGDLRQRFKLPRPRILVCGLNPHAGEGGHLGREEIEVITPVLDRLRAESMNLVGPLPADTLFVTERLRGADAVLAMYHDQGLPVLKHAGFGEAVNVTLGLPIVRTSVDHGTALDLAGNGHANAGSLRAAMRLAIRLARTART